MKSLLIGTSMLLLTTTASVAASFPDIPGEVREVGRVKGLLAERVIYQQFYDGRPIEGATAEVLRRRDGTEKLLTDNLLSHARVLPFKAMMQSDQLILERVTNTFGQSVIFRKPPSYSRVYLVSGGLLEPAVKVSIDATMPLFSGDVVVRESDGVVVHRHNKLQFHRDSAKNHTGFAAKASLDINRQSMTTKMGVMLANVWDPNPRVALSNADLPVDADISQLQSAVISVNVNPLFVFPNYQLTNDQFTLSDFDVPNTPVTTSSNGNFQFTARSDGFLDAMAFHHLNQMQATLTSSGYASLLPRGMGVDTDALGGQDNSAYDPQNNRLYLGRGGVPDAEDADVIRHELAHAIHDAAHGEWRGPDAGAIAEGFADFFAITERWKSLNGNTINPFGFALWDGFNEYWPGRIHNKSIQYEAHRGYGAHEPVSGGVADEIWGTPLVQATYRAYAHQLTPSVIQQYQSAAIEGVIASPGQLTMPDVALSTVRALHQLSSSISVASDLYTEFRAIAIIPHHAEIASQSLTRESAPTSLLPARDTDFSIEVRSTDFQTTNNITVRNIEFDDGIAVTAANQPILTLEPASSALLPVAKLHAAEQTECGHLFNGSIDLEADTSSGVEAQTRSISVRVGRPRMSQWRNTTPTAIPDAVSTGVQIPVTISGLTASAVVDENFSVSLDIAHTYLSDLRVELMSPSGTRVVLQRAGTLDANTPSYSVQFNHNPFSSLAGKSLNGVWKLIVSDLERIDTGMVNSVTIRGAGSYDCREQENRAPVANVSASNTSIGSTWITFDGSRSSDDDGDALSYSWRQITGTTAKIENPTNATTRVKLPDSVQTESLTFELTVSDGFTTGVSKFSVTVLPSGVPTPDAIQTSSEGGGGSYSILALLALSISFLIRQSKKQ